MTREQQPQITDTERIEWLDARWKYDLTIREVVAMFRAPQCPSDLRSGIDAAMTATEWENQ